MGHATRVIPIINLLLAKNYEVIIATDGKPYDLLKEYFPNLVFEKMPGYNITYARKNMALDIFLQIPKIISGVISERKATREIVKKHVIDVVISDNRYGVRSKVCDSYFITHQLNIQAPFLGKIINLVNHFFISKFKECWVPDLKTEKNLSGKLSKVNTNFPIKYIGPLSRFSEYSESLERGHDCLIMISGPEPKRSIFEKKLIESAHTSSFSNIGIISPKLFMEGYTSHTVSVYPQLEDKEFYNVINQSGVLITRSGYSTLMDCLFTRNDLFLIPTKGQTEQEYLASYFEENQWADSCSEDDFDWKKIPKHLKKFNRAETSILTNRGSKLEEVLREL